MKKHYILFLLASLIAFSVSAQLIINEVLYDPPGSGTTDLSGDANGDGTRNNDDEFIEFYNSGAEIDISGYTLSDLTSIRHTFPVGSIIPANGVLVLFGGGTPVGTFGGAIVQTASTATLNISNAADTMTLKDLIDQVIAEYTTDSGDPNMSYTRSPDITGNFVLHTTANAALLFSPGLKADGATLSIDTNFTKEELSIYPNPTNNGLVTIKSQLSSFKNITLFDMLGRSVLQTKLNSEVLDVRAIKSGLYLLQVSIGDRSSTSKLIIK
jgi:hypothetical protein